MGEVIRLQPRRPPLEEVLQESPIGVWTCGCDSQLWFLLMDGRCVCAQCYSETTVLRTIEVDLE